MPLKRSKHRMEMLTRPWKSRCFRIPTRSFEKKTQWLDDIESVGFEAPLAASLVRKIRVWARPTASASSRRRASSARGVAVRPQRGGSSCLFYRAATSTTTSVPNAEPPWAARWTTTRLSFTGRRRAHLSSIAVARNQRKSANWDAPSLAIVEASAQIYRSHRSSPSATICPVSATTDSAILIYGTRLRVHAGPRHPSRRV